MNRVEELLMREMERIHIRDIIGIPEDKWDCYDTAGVKMFSRKDDKWNGEIVNNFCPFKEEINVGDRECTKCDENLGVVIHPCGFKFVVCKKRFNEKKR